jgi:hypothetical protein
VKDEADALIRKLHQQMQPLLTSQYERISALAGLTPDGAILPPDFEIQTDERKPEFVAQNHEGWWTIQTFSGPKPRAFAIRKETGEVMELPDNRCPFVVYPSA